MSSTKGITSLQDKKRLLKSYKQAIKNKNQDSIQFFEFLLNLHEVEIK